MLRAHEILYQIRRLASLFLFDIVQISLKSSKRFIIIKCKKKILKWKICLSIQVYDISKIGKFLYSSSVLLFESSPTNKALLYKVIADLINELSENFYFNFIHQ